MARGRTVTIDASRIVDWDSFYDVFAQAFDFPGWWGRNMDAWIDLFTYMDGDDSMTGFRVGEGEVVTIRIDNARGFKERALEQYEALLECSAFVNWRRIEIGEEPFLCLAFFE